MNTSELIRLLTESLEEHGDLDVFWESMTHLWPPDPAVRTTAGGTKILMLNT